MRPGAADQIRAELEILKRYRTVAVHVSGIGRSDLHANRFSDDPEVGSIDIGIVVGIAWSWEIGLEGKISDRLAAVSHYLPDPGLPRYLVTIRVLDRAPHAGENEGISRKVTACSEESAIGCDNESAQVCGPYQNVRYDELLLTQDVFPAYDSSCGRIEDE